MRTRSEGFTMGFAGAPECPRIHHHHADAFLVQAGSGAPVGVRPATEDEISRDENVKRLAASAARGRWLALRPVNALPPDSPVSVVVGAGTPSAEGPRRTTEAQSFSFRTYGPLRMREHRCGWQGRCTPYDQWMITLSNNLDREALDPAQVKVEPEVPGLSVNAYGSQIYIHGQKRGRTQYRVTLAPSLRDEFGQTLGEPVTVTFNVGPAPPALFSTGGPFIVLDPAGGPHLSVFSVNQPSLKVSLYAVAPEDFGAYVAHKRGVAGYYDEKQQKARPIADLEAEFASAERRTPDGRGWGELTRAELGQAGA
jgi:hypothetical protein